MELKYVLYDGKSLRQNAQEYEYWLQVKKDLQLHQTVCIDMADPFRAEDFLGWSQALVLASDDSQVRMAQTYDAAVLGLQLEKAEAKITEFVPYILEGLEEVGHEFFYHTYLRAHHQPWTIVETKRCVVREMTLADVDALYELYALPGMTQFVEPLYERSEEETYMAAYIANVYGYYGYGLWLVFEKESDRLIGRAGFEEQTHGDESHTELGYMIATDCQRKGFAKEVCKALLKYAKENGLFQEVYCRISKENVSSLALAKSLGFQATGCYSGQDEEMMDFCLKF
ncbi:MAG: GNAT family N-acetyltransferase [Lachnospiraceae bacterium]